MIVSPQISQGARDSLLSGADGVPAALASPTGPTRSRHTRVNRRPAARRDGAESARRQATAATKWTTYNSTTSQRGLGNHPLGVTAGHRQQRLYRPLDEGRRGMHLVVNHFQLILKRSRYSL